MEIFWTDVAVLQAMRAMLRAGQSQAATYAAFAAWLAKKEHHNVNHITLGHHPPSKG